MKALKVGTPASMSAGSSRIALACCAVITADSP
jgi:hypothetical protein